MPLVHFELDDVRNSAERMAQENDRALAACGGHQFAPINPRIPRAGYRCARCGGIVSTLP